MYNIVTKRADNLQPGDELWLIDDGYGFWEMSTSERYGCWIAIKDVDSFGGVADIRLDNNHTIMSNNNEEWEVKTETQNLEEKE